MQLFLVQYFYFRLQVDQKVLSAESKITNAVLRRIRYKADIQSGYVAEETDSLGTKVAYQYDLNQNLTKVTLELAGLTDGIIENKYQYANDKLISIENNNTKYDLLYDEWGNPSGADIEGKPHVRYHYVGGNISFLQTQAYANGSCISYAYEIMAASPVLARMEKQQCLNTNICKIMV